MSNEKKSALVLEALDMLERCCCLEHNNPSVPWSKWMLYIFEVQHYLLKVNCEELEKLKSTNASMNNFAVRALKVFDRSRTSCCQTELHPHRHGLQWFETVLAAQHIIEKAQIIAEEAAQHK